MFLRPFGSCVLTVASATLRDVERQALTRFLCLFAAKLRQEKNARKLSRHEFPSQHEMSA